MSTLIILVLLFAIYTISEKKIDPKKRTTIMVWTAISTIALSGIVDIVAVEVKNELEKSGIIIPWVKEDSNSYNISEDSLTVDSGQTINSDSTADNNNENNISTNGKDSDEVDWNQTGKDVHSVYYGIKRIYNAFCSNPVMFFANSCAWILENKWIAPFGDFVYRHTFGMGILGLYLYATYLLIIHKKVFFPEGLVFFLGVGLVATADDYFKLVKSKINLREKDKSSTRRKKKIVVFSENDMNNSLNRHGRVVDKSGKPYVKKEYEELRVEVICRGFYIMLVQIMPFIITETLLKKASNPLYFPLWAERTLFLLSVAVFQIAVHTLSHEDILEDKKTGQIIWNFGKIITLVSLIFLFIVWLGVYYKYYV